MSLVDPDTGEIVASADDARALTDRIKAAVDVAWDLICEAYTTQAWRALGYTSWDHYCGQEFRGARLRLPLEDRREVVASLRDAGMSSRAIAAATGLDRGTVRNDLQVGGNHPPAVTDEVSNLGDSAVGQPEAEVIHLPPVTGMDGKTYQPPAPKPAPPAMTEDEQRDRDLAVANENDARRLRQIIKSWESLATLQTNERRGRILALLNKEERAAVLAIEGRLRRA